MPIASIRIASDMPAGERPSYEVMDTSSATFAQLSEDRANRHDDFYIRPAGGVDLCNVQVPVRKKAKRLGRPDVGVAVLVLDDDRRLVRAHARLGERQSGRAESAFGAEPGQ